jgi:hypothetical protein
MAIQIGKKQVGMLVDLKVWEQAKMSGMRFPYIFEMGLQAPELRMLVTKMEGQIRELEADLNKRGERLLFLQTELQKVNAETDLLKGKNDG